MKRRTRPLDTTEHRSVDADKPMGVELMRDTTDYVLKWPDAPLSKLLQPKPSAARTDTVKVPLCVADPSAVTIDVQRQIGTTTRSAATNKTASKDVFSIPTHWKVALGRQLSAAEQVQMERQVVVWEHAAALQWNKTSLSMQRLLALQAAVPYKESGMESLYQLWLAERLASRTPDRPWGVPVVASLIESMELDEYFISTKDYGHDGDEDDEKKPRRSAAADRRAALQNGSRGGHMFDFLPFEMGKLKNQGQLFRSTARSTERDNEQAAALIAALPESLRQTKFTPKQWAVDDVADEVENLRNAKLLEGTVGTL